MNKKTKKLLILLGVFALLVGAYLALTLPQQSGQGDPTPPAKEQETQSYDFFALNADALVGFSYTFGGETYEYNLNADKTRWLWSGDPTLPLSNGDITLMMNSVLSLSSDVRYTDIPADALEDYGLGKTAQRLTFRYADGTESGLLLGKINAFNSQAYCVLVSDPSTVYMVSAGILPYFAKLPSALIEDDALPRFTEAQLLGYTLQTGEESVMLALEYLSEEVGEDEERQLVCYRAGEDAAVLDPSVRDAVVQAMLSWNLKNALTFDPAQYGEYGVSDEAEQRLSIQYTFTQSYTDEQTGATNSTEMRSMVTLLIGETREDGLTYVRLSGKTGVYALDLSAVMGAAES